MENINLKHTPLRRHLVRKLFANYKIMGYSFDYYSDSGEVLHSNYEGNMAPLSVENAARTILEDLLREKWRERYTRWSMAYTDDGVIGKWDGRNSYIKTDFNFIFKRR